MSNTDNNESKPPSVLQTVGAGIVGGIIAWLIFTVWVAWVDEAPEEIISGLARTPSEPGFYALLFVCIIGAFVGRAKGKSYKAMWLGATLPFLIWAVLGFLGVLIFCCN